MRKKLALLVVLPLVFIVAASILYPARATAATAENCKPESNSFLKFPTWYKYLDHSFVDGTPGNPATNPPIPATAAECKVKFDITADIGKILLAVVEILLRVGGMVAVGFVIYGGVLYVLSEGKPDNAGKALSTIINAMIGLAIAVSATVIVNLIGNTLIK